MIRWAESGDEREPPTARDLKPIVIGRGHVIAAVHFTISFKHCMSAFNTFLTALSNAANLEGVLGDESIEYPPSENVDYWATPQNAVVFGWMGVDGVHDAILKINGHILDTSPVIQIGPMDFDQPYSLLAPSFIDYLAIGCGVTANEIQRVIADEEAGHSSLLDFMRSNFKQARFWSDEVDRDIEPFATMIVQ